jgi:large subunit ribosomal protein L21
MSTYAIVKTGGKQYRVEQGQTLLVERLRAGDGESVALEPLLFVNGSEVLDGEALARVSVEARVVAHQRGPKLRVVKFKPKRGYKRRTGHRQELTRIEVTSLGVASGDREARSSAPAPVAADAPATAPAPAAASAPVAADAPATASAPPAAPSTEEAENGS